MKHVPDFKPNAKPVEFGSFPEDEIPTRPGGLPARVSVLVANFCRCSRNDQAWFERMIELAANAPRDQ